MGRKQKPQQIEQTSKEWKGLKVFGVLLLLVGVGASFWALLDAGAGKEDAGTPMLIGVAALISGAFVYMLAAVCAWWNHG